MQSFHLGALSHIEGEGTSTTTSNYCSNANQSQGQASKLSFAFKQIMTFCFVITFQSQTIDQKRPKENITLMAALSRLSQVGHYQPIKWILDTGYWIPRAASRAFYINGFFSREWFRPSVKVHLTKGLTAKLYFFVFILFIFFFNAEFSSGWARM